MITLALDEYGKFEEASTNDAVFIGGIMYDDCGVDGDKEKERDRIESYYKAVCEQVKAIFPDHLHSKGNEKNNKVCLVKKEVSNTLNEFLKKGTYRGNSLVKNKIPIQPRKGRYMIYVVVKSECGKSERVLDNPGFMINDIYGPNLYFHMATETLKRTIFQNPVLKRKEHFELEIATRVSPSIQRGSDKETEFIKLGYNQNKNYNNTGRISMSEGSSFYLTNQDVYRSILEQYLVEDNVNESVIDDLKVQSIRYDDNRRQEFLYLADSICSVLSRNLWKINTGIEQMEEINKRAVDGVGEENALVFAYDAVDIDYSKAYMAYQNRDYVDALTICYTVSQKAESMGEQTADGYCHFYMKKWFKLLLNKMQTPNFITKEQITQEKNAFVLAVRKLQSMFFSNCYDQNCGLFIMSNIETLCSRLSKSTEVNNIKKYIYYYYDLFMTAYCHIADSANAEKYYYLATKYASAVSMEEYLRTRNMYVVMLTDSFQWEKAKRVAIQNLEYNKKIYSLKREIDEQRDEGKNIAECKAYSQLGQIYAFMKDEEAEKCFLIALSSMQMGTPDYYITESYLLHFYIIQKEQKKYERVAKEYFGEHSNLREQLDYILETSKLQSPIISIKFALYLYLKALYCFYQDCVDTDDVLWEKIVSLNKLLNLVNNGNDHPYEMIYKYIQLLAIKRGDKETKRKYANYYNKSEIKWEDINPLLGGLQKWGKISPLLVCIQKFGEIEVARDEGNEQVCHGILTELVTILEDCFPTFRRLGNLKGDENKIAAIEGKFTYMFD